MKKFSTIIVALEAAGLKKGRKVIESFANIDMTGAKLDKTSSGKWFYNIDGYRVFVDSPLESLEGRTIQLCEFSGKNNFLYLVAI